MSFYDFFTNLTDNAFVLTPNRRLSATLHKFYQQYQLEHHYKTWNTPNILPAMAWINRLWNQFISDHLTSFKLLLNSSQEQFIWEKIVLLNKDNEQLLQISETAELVKSAWNLLNQWQIDFNHPLFNTSEDGITLKNWIDEFKKQCKEQGWVDTASLPAMLIKHIQSDLLHIPKKICLFGFTELNPEFTQLLNACQTKGCQVEKIAFTTNKVQCRRLQLVDQEDEILTIARFAKSILKSHPLARVGCVIPSLDKIRDRVSQIFSQVFADENTYTLDSQNTLFNISAGKNLARYPVIHAALKLLNLHKKTLSSETLSYLLTTPFIGEAETERIKRAQFDAQLRLNNKTIFNLVSETVNFSCPLLAKRIRNFLLLLEENPEALSYHNWAECFNTLLISLGWPGERSLNSEEYQTVEHWLNLLNEFKTLDQVAPPCHFPYAVLTLQKMANLCQFQMKTPEASIQVLGLLEAAGLPFDYLWIAGMDDLTWPPPPKPNPFIPKRLQRELQMPHATAKREFLFCQNVTQQFKQSADFVIFSHANKNEDIELQVSPLIKDIELITKNELALEEYLSPSYKIYLSKKIEMLIDETAPAIGSSEKIVGGVNIIKHQALCPFKAFSTFRLHAQELESPLIGFRAKDRGTILHKALEIIWNTLKNHVNLITISESELSTLIKDSIEKAFSLLTSSPSEFTNYLSLEKERCHHLIFEWLQIEKTRSPFKVIISEKASQLPLGPLTLTIKIDRVDELENGKKLVIDYKTGKNNEINTWFSERPDEPQLPIYALLDVENTCAITFAQINPHDFGFKGVSHVALDIKGIKLISEIKKTKALSWNDQLREWQRILTKLSEDFYKGCANVNPKESSQTCMWCKLKPLCRINEEITIL